MRRSPSLASIVLSIFLLYTLPRTFSGVTTQPLTSSRRRSAMASVSFSHVHIYCDSLKDLSEYKTLEEKLNSFSSKHSKPSHDLELGRKAWSDVWDGHPVIGHKDPTQFKGHQQDVVEQMLVGLGWRITGHCDTADTRTVAITSRDAQGVRFIITAHKELKMADLASDSHPAAKRHKSGQEPCHALAASNLQRFSEHRAGRQGIAVLGFKVKSGELDHIVKKYKEKHPKLLATEPKDYPGARILEVFAYYQGETGSSDADQGTLLRFVEEKDASNFWVLPGIQPVEATFDQVSLPAYCDHWVSNVVSRRGFLDTLEDTLGFTPKVDFNAGVVAAGEAQIESTVTGNTPETLVPDANVALKDQSQVYLPINNALSEVGHVHLYLKEVGQGVQHIASRVEDLPTLVQRANDMRKMTGAGLSFLSIPRSYYGSLTARYLCKAGVDLATAEKVLATLKSAEVVDANDIVDLEASKEKIQAALPAENKGLLDHVLRARYGNLYALLREHVSEETYLRIVRNNVLVDVQGEDLLLQIFTSSILQRQAGEEAPFLEFIQRVCSERNDPATGKPKAIKAGCGGFGIRNFLTLFLSIEVSKATKARAEAEAAGKMDLARYYGNMVNTFTSQLEESNPVLTAISDAMTAEGDALDAGDQKTAAKYAQEKAKGQGRLQEISSKYKQLMRQLREEMPEMA